VPSAEHQFIDTVNSANRDFLTAPNDLAQQAVMTKRDAELCAIVRPGAIHDWIGTVEEVRSSFAGSAIVTVAIEPNVFLSNDALLNEKIDPDTSLFSTAIALRNHQRVKLSATFLPGTDTCVDDRAVFKPNFLVTFTDLAPV
jgi:hypothetical protein